MQPYYQDDLVTLYHGDCREVDEWLAADVLITDPPYGRGWSQPAMRSRSGAVMSNHHDGIANDKDTKARDAALAMWGSGPAFVFGDLMLAPPPGTRQVAVYVKPPDAGTRGVFGGVKRDCEAIYLMGDHRCGVGGRSGSFRTTARTVGNPSGLAARYGHPHAKPQDVLQELVQLTTGVVADPFAGSGSTLRAAKNLGRRAIGVELEERYCELVARNLSQDCLFV